VQLQLEAYDARGRLLLPRQTLRYIHGTGKQAESVELAVATMLVGESCDVRCYWRPGIRGGPQLCADPWFPVSYRLTLESVMEDVEDIQNTPSHAGKLAQEAACLHRAGRHLLACHMYKDAAQKLEVEWPMLSKEMRPLHRRCLAGIARCELQLGLWRQALASADALLAEHGSYTQASLLRAAAMVVLDPEAAMAGLLELTQREPQSHRAQRLLARAWKKVKKQRRARRWFDGQGTEERTAAAKSSQVCYQCGLLKPGGQLSENGSKWGVRYYCPDCWECWRRIRRCQQRELERRVDKAVHSDYSTHTDELPSLDEAPPEWDAYHPMWHRERQECPDWQLTGLNPCQRRKALEVAARRKARQKAAQKSQQEVEQPHESFNHRKADDHKSTCPSEWLCIS